MAITWKSMHELKQALHGQITFSSELGEINKCLFHGQVPMLSRSYMSQTKKTLATWMEHIRQRNQQDDKWIQEGELRVINLGGLHVPESYVSAIMQTFARKNQRYLDKVSFHTTVTPCQTIDDVNESKQGTWLIEGLYLEGAGWDIENHCLMEQTDKQPIQMMPLIQVVPVETHRLHMPNHFSTPMYATSDRQNAMGVGLVFEVNLYTKKDLSHWLLSGVCLLLNKDL